MSTATRATGPTEFFVLRGGGRGRVAQSAYLPEKPKNPHTTRGVHQRLFFFTFSSILAPEERRKLVEAMVRECDIFSRKKAEDPLHVFWQNLVKAYNGLVGDLLEATSIPDGIRRKLLEYFDFNFNFDLKHPVKGSKPNAVTLVITLQHAMRAWTTRLNMGIDKFLDNDKGTPEAQPQKAGLITKIDEFTDALQEALETFAKSCGVQLRPLPERRDPTSNPLKTAVNDEDYPALD
jgi:hypothetical protein